MIFFFDQFIRCDWRLPPDINISGFETENYLKVSEMIYNNCYHYAHANKLSGFSAYYSNILLE